MSSEVKKEIQLEIAHVLFIDIVGYSKRLTNEQTALVNLLNERVLKTGQCRTAEAAGKLIRIPTGDGIALVFFTTPDAPVRCAIELAKADRREPQIELRMGLHSGPVDQVTDVNARSNVAGAGINMAQRVMDCGDAGHILLSKRLADDLSQYSDWKSKLHPLGEVEVKHGVTIAVANLFDAEVGNSTLPEKIRRARQTATTAARRRTVAWVAGLLVIAAIGGAVLWRHNHRAPDNATLQKSIAVLPLENLSEDKADAFFADGIQDDVLTSLAQISDLKVISRTSVMQYRGATRNLRDIGRALGVANILEGSVRRVANRVLVNVQLIDALHDRHLWAERYDRTITDSIGLQGELATEIARALPARLDPGEKARLATRPTSNPEAYVLFLKARDKEYTAGSKEDAFAVDALYDQAVALDPKFALALARQSMWNSIMYFVGRRPEQKIKAHALATEALRVAPDLAEAHLAQGFWFFRAERDFDGALKQFSIAAQTMSNEPELLINLGTIYRRQGRWREAQAEFQHAQELDPRNFHGNLASTYTVLRNWPAARAEYRHQLDIKPEDDETKMSLAWLAVFADGDVGPIKAILQKLPPDKLDDGGRPRGDLPQIRWQVFMLERDFAAAEKVLREYPAEEFPPPSVAEKSFAFACTALARGDSAVAQRLFEKARPAVEAAAAAHRDEPRYLARLGLLYAYLGRKDDALRESRRAVELCPENKDAVEGPNYSINLAQVYAWTGQGEEAVGLLEHLLTTPVMEGELTLAKLRLSWEWDPLRNNPSFQKILASPEPKTIYN